MKITHSTILAAVVLGTAAVSTHAADLAMRGVQRNENVDRRLDPSSGDEKEEKVRRRSSTSLPAVPTG